MKREATWKRLEEIAAMKATSNEPVLVPRRATTHTPSGQGVSTFLMVTPKVYDFHIGMHWEEP